MRHNPFSSCFVKPGQLAFQFSNADAQRKIVDHFQAPGAQGAVIGPHGTGKSTLLKSLDESWRSLGLDVHQRRFTTECTAWSKWPPLQSRTMLVVDGFEQLSWLARRKLRKSCERSGARLLVTCHHDCGVPVIYRTSVDWPLARSFCQRSIPEPLAQHEEEIAAVWKSSVGNMREFFFQMYHLCERNGWYRSDRRTVLSGPKID